MKAKLLYLSVYLVYFATPFESVEVIPGVSVVKLVSVLFILVAMYYYRGFAFPRQPFFYVFALFTGFALLSTAWSLDKETTLINAIGTTVPTFILLTYLFLAIENRDHIEKIFKAYGLASFIVALIAIYMFYMGISFGNPAVVRLSVLGQDQNELSVLLSMGVVSTFYLLLYSTGNSKLKLFYILNVIVLSFVILSTGSRTGFVILLSIGVVLFFLTKGVKKVLYFVIAAVTIITLLIFVIPDSTTERLLQTITQIQDRDLTNRVEIWDMGIRAFQKEGAFIQGVGFKTFPDLMQKHFHWAEYPHNTYLVILIELGLIGFILYMTMIFIFIKKAYLLYKTVSLFHILFILPILMAMFTLGLEGRRWLFIFGILLIKLSEFSFVKIQTTNELNNLSHEEDQIS